MMDTSHPADPRSKMLNKISLAPMVRMVSQVLIIYYTKIEHPSI